MVQGCVTEIKKGIKASIKIGGYIKSSTSSLKDGAALILQEEQIIYSIAQKSHLTGWLTSSSKSSILERVEYMKKYIKNHKDDLNYTSFRKDFEEYYDKNGNFIYGYMQNKGG